MDDARMWLTDEEAEVKAREFLDWAGWGHSWEETSLEVKELARKAVEKEHNVLVVASMALKSAATGAGKG